MNRQNRKPSRATIIEVFVVTVTKSSVLVSLRHKFICLHDKCLGTQKKKKKKNHNASLMFTIKKINLLKRQIPTLLLIFSVLK